MHAHQHGIFVNILSTIRQKLHDWHPNPKQTCRLLPLWMIWMGMSLGAMRCNRAMDHGLASFLSEFNA
jgi:hypothetical protein